MGIHPAEAALGHPDVGDFAQDRSASITTIALRVPHTDAMIGLYSQTFGVRFRTVDTGGIRSHFGDLGAVTLKLVPIRDAPDFQGFAVHQLGVSVPDVRRVITLAVGHGGREHQAPAMIQGRWHASVRDPDGNTLELYGLR